MDKDGCLSFGKEYSKNSVGTDTGVFLIVINDSSCYRSFIIARPTSNYVAQTPKFQYYNGTNQGVVNIASTTGDVTCSGCTILKVIKLFDL